MGVPSYHRWWFRTVLLLGVLQVLAAVISDPYCVFGIIRYPKYNFEPNVRFLKVEYLERHPAYDAFLFGSSRASYYEADTAARACTGYRRYYNFNVSLENGAGIRRKVDWLLATRPVRQVIMNLDFDIQSEATDPLDLLRQEHPLLSGSPYTAFYGKYLLFQPRILWLFAAANRRPARNAPWNFGNPTPPETLYPTRPRFDFARLQAVTVGAMARDLARWNDAADPPAPNGFEEFRRTVQSLDRAGVERILIVPPYRLDQFAGFEIESFIGWLKETVQVAGAVWDFSGYNTVTANPENYVDRVHFSRSVGDRVLQTACAGAPGTSPTAGGFGVYVTAENVDQRVAELREQHRRARSTAIPFPP